MKVNVHSGFSARREDGAAVVAAMSMIGLLVVLAVVSGAAASIVVGHRRVQAAADLAVLGAATALGDGGDPCAAAATLAHRNGAISQSCAVVGWTVTVVVGRQLPAALGGAWLRARARAGPVQE